jgi:hypothetical protein
MTQDWTINSLSEETGLDRRTIKKILKDTAPNDVDGKNEFYKMVDFVRALVEYHKPDNSSDALEREKVRKTAAEADILEVERARIRNEVIETETVFRVIENRDIAIRRTILTSELSDERKDAILRELQRVTVQDFLEQRDYDQGAPAEIEPELRAAG